MSRSRAALCLAIGIIAGAACNEHRQPKPASTVIDVPISQTPSITTLPPPPTPAPPKAPPALPDYLVRLAEGGEVSTRDATGAILPPRNEDNAVLRHYPQWPDKGLLTGTAAERLTILTAKTSYAAYEEIRVIHVHEATLVGVTVYVMGPKAIYGEYVDGVLASPAVAAPPSGYDGRIIESPWEDHNYEVSTYRLPSGDHEIHWRFATLSGPTVLRSNVLTLHIR